MNKMEVVNRGLNQSTFDVIWHSFDISNCYNTLDIKLTYLGKGIAGMTMSPDPKFSTQGGRVHGGLIATMADSVMGAAAITLSGIVYRTVEFNLNYLAPVFEETELIAEGRVIHPGNTVAVVTSSIYNNRGQLLAESRGTFIKDNKTILGGG